MSLPVPVRPVIDLSAQINELYLSEPEWKPIDEGTAKPDLMGRF